METQPRRYRLVMLIDDNEIDNFMHERLIELNHFAEKIHVNSSGVSALEYLGKLAKMDSAVYPDVIFIDINMPIMDGFQFIKNFQGIGENKFSNTKLVVLTSSVNSEDEIRTKSLSENILFFNKPLTDEMLARI